MVDLAITATQVLPGADAQYVDGIAGEPITAGQPCYQNSSGFLVPADADASAATANVRGIALNGAATGQPVRLQHRGTLTLGAAAAPAIGTIYVLSGTAGGIAPAVDLATGDWVTILGVGGATNTLILSLVASGSQVPV